MLICADWLISALTCDPHLRASGTMLRPPGAPARAPSPAAPGSVIAGPGMQAGLAPLAWRDGRGPAVISARSMSARLGSAAPGAP